MRNNTKFYLYIGLGAIAIVVLCAWLMTMFRNNREENSGNNPPQQQESVRPGDDTSDNLPEQNNDTKQEKPLENIEDIPDENQILPQPTPDVPISEMDDDLDYYPEEESVNVSAKQYTFHAGSILQWPVYGNVIINYSMEKMVYLETLDSYKYFPGMCIEAEVGTPVVAGATGEVISVTNEPDTGLTVAMRIGPEYVIYYGQLDQCDLKVGDHINRGEEFAKVGKQTNHFLVEGSHLYLRLERDEESVNPLSYLDFSE